MIEHMEAVWRLASSAEGIDHMVYLLKFKGDAEWTVSHGWGPAGCSSEEITIKYYHVGCDKKHAEVSAKSFVDKLTGLEPSLKDLANWKQFETSETEGQPYPVVDRIQHYEVRSSDPEEIKRKMEFVKGQSW